MPWNDNNNNDGPRNPWGGPERGNTHNDSPWGSQNHGRSPEKDKMGGGHQGGQGGDLPPELDELLRRARQNFKHVMPGDFGFGHALLLSVAAILTLWLSSGFYFIQPNENSVVLTFGKYAHTDERAGLKYALPWPIQQVYKVDVTSERRVEVGFSSSPSYRSGGQLSEQNTENESLMLTGDENIIDIDFAVTWRIGDARQFLFEIRNPEDTIKLVAESAMREVIARTKITAALTEARGQIQTDTKALIQKILDEYKSGIVINNVQLLKVDPPDPVIDAFNDVQRARAEAERMENEAQAYRNDILPRARGESQKTLEDALAYKQEVMARARGDADRFNSVYAAYSQSRDVTTERLYLETIESVLQNAKTVILENGKGGAGALPILPLNELTKRLPSGSAAEPPQPTSSR